MFVFPCIQISILGYFNVNIFEFQRHLVLIPSVTLSGPSLTMFIQYFTFVETGI